MEDTPITGRPAIRVVSARRFVGLERHYSCEACGHEHSSWSRLRACPRCRAPLGLAVIRRAAVAAIA